MAPALDVAGPSLLRGLRPFLLGLTALSLFGCPDELGSSPPDAGAPDSSDASASDVAVEEAAAVACPGLGWSECGAASRCGPRFGIPFEDPYHFRYAGCRTYYAESGDAILTNTEVTCGRAGVGSSCYLFADSGIPDTWEALICTNLPPECGGSEHPAYLYHNKCAGLQQVACEEASGCAAVFFASGAGEYAGCRTAANASGTPIPNQGPMCAWNFDQSAKCAHFASWPPDGWLIQDCTSACE